MSHHRTEAHKRAVFRSFFIFILLFSTIPGLSTVAAATAFECSPTLYQVLNVPNLGQLNVLDPATASYVPIGSPQGGYNATGYNPDDNFIYGLDNTGLVQIDAENIKQSVTLNLISGGLPAGAAGDFDTSGNYVGGAGANLWLINNIDAVNLTADSQSLTTNKSIASSDLTYLASEDKYYGVGANALHIVEVDEIALTATITDVPLTGLAGDTGAFGAAWADASGVLLFYNNDTGHIWQVTDYTTANPVANLLLTATPVDSNDGMSCGATSLLDDNDGDGVIDVFDADNDNDGIPNLVEGYGDADGDGIADAFDLDADNDGIPDTVEFGTDEDADLDGVIDALEDADGDTIPDVCDVDQAGGGDSDTDQIIDTCDVTNLGGSDTDNDGIADSEDADQDGDGLADVIDPSEGGVQVTELDTDADGVPDVNDLDSENDGIPDTTEAGTPDIDGNGLTDSMEIAGGDLDGDGLADILDSTAGGTPVTPTDTGNDSSYDFQVIDSDGDTIPDSIEADVVGDNNADGILDTMADADLDSIPDSADIDQTAGVDTDGDGIDDAADVDQTGGADTDGDSIDDTADPDADGNGFADGNEPANGGAVPPLTNTDADGPPDYQDTDSDNDTILDAVELTDDPDNDGDGNYRDIDSDGDGLDDATEVGDPNNPVDSDNDGTPDYLQNDGVADTDGDGISDDVDLDDDNDGIPDSVEGTMDTDADGVPDYLDLDSDNDGIFDLLESGAVATVLDTNNDGRIDTANFPVGNNGLADALETTPDSGQTDYDGDGNVDEQIDTDGDLLPDFLDLDSDNDGITDVIESGGDDADGDGVIGTGVPVVNVNGLAPGAGVIPVDSDSDGVADFRDLDSDNDAITDNVEAQTSSNFVPPTGNDSDGDGLDDAYDPDNGGSAVPLVDSDGDTIPDYLDIDSDNDGANDIVEAGLTDSNSDGRVDNFTDANGDGLDDAVALSPVTLLDENNNNEADYRESDVVSGGDTCACKLETGIDGHGGAFNWRLLILLLPAIFRCQLKTLLINYRPVFVAGIASLIAIPGQGIAENSSADREFSQRFYIGANIGVSKLEPESPCNCYSVDDDSDTAFSLFLGYDLSPRFTLEGYYSQMGEAGIESSTTGDHVGELEYEQFGLSLLGYLYNSKDAYDFNEPSFDDEGLFRREGLSAFGRIGAGGLSNSSDLEFEKQNSAHLHLGVGLEYGWSNGLAARAEFISFDKDTKLLAIGLLKRFGHVDTYAALAVSTNEPEPVIEAPVVAASELVEVMPPVVAPVEVEEKAAVSGVASRDGEPTLPVVYFNHDRRALTDRSVTDLSELASDMKANLALVLEVRGHTDSQGDEAYNQTLSEKRANEVRDYLIDLGVSAKQLQAAGYGETVPMADNDTVEGRDINRRVDFTVISK